MNDWEQRLHQELDALPDLQAPATLVPAVLRRIESQRAPRWYHAPWWQWPPALRVTSFLIVLIVLGGLGWVSGAIDRLNPGDQLLQACGRLKDAAAAALAACEPALGAGESFWGHYGQLMVTGAAGLLFAAYLTCLAAGTALYRLAWRRAV